MPSSVSPASPASPAYPASAYSIVLFDLDHTLFDFEGSKTIAFREVLAEQGIEATLDHAELFESVERPLWRGLESGELTLDTLNDRRFAGLVEATGFDADPVVMSSSYLQWLGKSGGLLPGARDLLDKLDGQCEMVLVSNGYGQVQHARMANFDLARYFVKVVVSNEVGFAKPDPRFFEHTFSVLGHQRRDESLMVGDSLTSDIAGANNYDLDCCWYNPAGAPANDHVRIDHIVTELSEIATIVLGA